MRQSNYLKGVRPDLYSTEILALCHIFIQSTDLKGSGVFFSKYFPVNFRALVISWYCLDSLPIWKVAGFILKKIIGQLPHHCHLPIQSSYLKGVRIFIQKDYRSTSAPTLYPDTIYIFERSHIWLKKLLINFRTLAISLYSLDIWKVVDLSWKRITINFRNIVIPWYCLARKNYYVVGATALTV